ncbi:MAG: DUF4333 domain-containing protein [Gordonia sp. (in: high G+C Gram-positive bacteria)]|uniref:DUF4333 domain-containing protein n=2 Tax=Gordonia sp. (in: high G+C Gram-positive bacteria) TaxID=84139 RepID=UPI003C7276B3
MTSATTTSTAASEASGLDARTLETSVSKELTKMAGQSPDEVRCEGKLIAEVGATQNCALRSGSTWLPVTVTSTGLVGTTLEFKIKVGETAIPAPSY